PAGKHVVLTDLPLNVIPLADNKHALVATSGFNKHELSLIDLTTFKVVNSETVRESWCGLAVAPAEDRGWWSGGGANMLHTFDLKGGKRTRTRKAEPDPSKMTREEQAEYRAERARQKAFKSGLYLDARTQTLYSLDITAGTITALNLADDSAGKPVACGVRP